MKKQLLLLMFGGVALLNSCEVTVNEGESSGEGTTELKNGFSYENIHKSLNGIVPVTNEVIAGEYLIVKFDGISNATIKDGFQHVGIGLKVYGPDGELYDEGEDLLSNIEQQDPNMDNCHFYFAVPKEFIGSTMKLEYSLYDKYGDVSYDFTEEYNVVDGVPPITKGVEIETSLSAEIYPQIFEKEYQAEKCPVEVGNQFGLEVFLSNVSGFTLNENEEASLAYKVTLENSAGEVATVREDLLEGPVGDVTGYPLSFSLSYDDLPDGDYIWRVYVTDNQGDHYINIAAPIKVG